MFERRANDQAIHSEAQATSPSTASGRTSRNSLSQKRQTPARIFNTLSNGLLPNDPIRIDHDVQVRKFVRKLELSQILYALIDIVAGTAV